MNFIAIERKWQKRWAEKKAFQVSENSKKEKCYVLEMYPYPSGTGLHMGHVFNYSIGDTYSRMKRMQGFNVLYPMGYDSFGLPAENAAIKAKSHPKKFTEDAIKNFIKQQKALGLSYDWSRILMSHDPNFYRWDQWIFLKMFEKGLAYKKEAPVNWCSKCKTVLANEQVINGRCWRHGDTEVRIKNLEQWFFKTTSYADELYEKIRELREWPEEIKRMQKNWIGKSHGVEIKFDINGEKWPIFTTRPDTLFGVTFMVVSAQHFKLDKLVTKEQKKHVEKFLKKIKGTSEKDLGDLEKEGAFTGSYAKHPLTGEKIPVWTGNFVLAEYGSGMVMAVPGHDSRDFDFAKKYKIKIKEVISGGDVSKAAHVGEGELVNSEGFNGLKSREAKEHIVNALKMKKLGKKTTQFKLRDWLISRQRFWGTPIPIIYCDSCGIVPVKEKDLPVKLPDNVKFSSKENPLRGHRKFVDVKCPSCGKKADRETDTMDTFVNSSWYLLRYCDPKNSKKIFDRKKVDYWAPVDTYIGGREHATAHLIYSRFYTKFLRDIGMLDFSEPAKRLFNQGMIHGEDGTVMSKSKGNVVDPMKVVDSHGADVLRMFLVSVASPDKDFSWSEKGVGGIHKFVNKVVDFVSKVKKGKSSKKVEHNLNKAVREISGDIENFRHNFAVIKLRSLVDSFEKEISGKDLKSFVKMFSVFCPHVGEELWENIGGKGFVSLSSWPKVDEKKIDEKIDRAEQLTRKIIEDIQNILKLIKGDKIYVYAIPDEKEFYDVMEIERRIGKKANVYSVADKNKYDPQGKSKKVKPGRPGIYVE